MPKMSTLGIETPALQVARVIEDKMIMGQAHRVIEIMNTIKMLYKDDKIDLCYRRCIQGASIYYSRFGALG